MNLRGPLGVSLILLFSACGSHSLDTGPTPKTESESAASAPEISRLVVLRRFAGHEPGDTVRVDLTEIGKAGRVAVYAEGGRTGNAPLEVLGIIGSGPMIVAADRANVRRCRSKGCSVVGYVVRGQVVQVRDYLDSWYRFSGPDGTRGYIWAEDLRLLELVRWELLAEYRERTAAYYEQELAGVSVERRGKLFAGHELRLQEGLLDFAFYARNSDGPALAEICSAMRGIARFVESLVADAPPEVFPAYSAGIYFDSPDSPARDDVMLAGLSSGGSIYCDTP